MYSPSLSLSLCCTCICTRHAQYCYQVPLEIPSSCVFLCFCLFPFSERIDLINSVADLKLDNKRLQDMNKALQLQMERSEENLKEIQAENEGLKQRIKQYVRMYT